MIRMAHLRARAAGGGWINFAVFDARATDGDHDRVRRELTELARADGLQVDQSALVFSNRGRLQFHGDKLLVEYLAKNWFPQWTHRLEVDARQGIREE